MNVHSFAVSAPAFAVWLGVCWYVAGAFAGTIAQRTVATLVLCTSIGLVLGLVAALTAPALWLAAFGLAVLRFVTRRTPSAPARTQSLWPYGVASSAVAFIAWPSLLSRPTDGDTLIYHLPNAASWLHAHSLWTTDAHYWWYPPGSELLAAVGIAIAGAFAISMAGMLGILALCFALYEAINERTGHATFAICCAIAFVSSHLAAVQGGDLQNDCLLSAVFVVALDRRQRSAATFFDVSGLALIKPSGWIFAAIAAICAHPKRWTLPLIIAVVVAGWWLRNVVLAHVTSQTTPAADVSDLFSTSIAAHGITGLVTLAKSAPRDGLSTSLFLACAFASIVLARRSYVARAGLLSTAAWLLAPYSYESGDVAQLSSGAALRFALPAMACGLIAIGPLVVRLDERVRGTTVCASAVLCALAIMNLATFFSTYRQFRVSTSMPWILLVGLALTVFCCTRLHVARQAKAAIATLATLALLMFAGIQRDAVRLVADYSWAFDEQGAVATSLPAVVRASPAELMSAVGFAQGMLILLKPSARVLDVPETADVCRFAAATGATVFVHRRPATQSLGCSITRLNSSDLEVRPLAR